MSQIAAGHGHDGHAHAHAPPHVEARRHLNLQAVTLAPGAGRMLFAVLLIGGLVALAALVLMALPGGMALRHAVAAYHTGFVYATGIAVTCLGMQMILQQFNAGWSGAVLRQAQNVSSCVWICALLFIPVVILGVFNEHGRIFPWADPARTDPSSPEFDTLLDAKRAFLNGPFWLVRSALYFSLWTILAVKLRRLSREQDATGNKWLTARARRISSYGLLIFALTSAFAAFDWLMSLDYHWFSTMFGVYFFASAIRGAVALLVVILCVLMIRGKMNGAFTIEHLHDLGKLLFAFTVFWAYISFDQYFLMWYSNIPEETGWFNLRLRPEWQPFPRILVLCNFVIPFLLLLIRKVKRNPVTLLPVALLCLVAYAMDLYFVVRPMVENRPGANLLIDVFGLVGPVFVFLAFVVRKIVSAPLIPIQDPRLHEVLEHKNYV